MNLDESPMSVIHYFPGLSARDSGERAESDRTLAQLRQATGNAYCAYNATRERLLSLHVAVVSSYSSDLGRRLLAVGEQHGQPLWIVPLVAISPSSVRVPVDLVFLNDECDVLTAIDSFPRNTMTAVPPKATSVLVLPAEFVAKNAIVGGDRLILEPPEELRRRIQSSYVDMANSPKSATNDPRPASSDSGEVVSPAAPAERVVPITRAVEKSSAEAAAAAIPIKPETAPEPAAATAASTDPKPWLKHTPRKSWFVRLIAGEPEDPRMPRETVPGLISFYFTGGAPLEHPVRDISLTGLYIVTEERWYIGTVLRITLSDRVGGDADHSLTLNAKVIRHGRDGVGLKFMLGDDDTNDKSGQLVDHSNGVTRLRLQEFIYRLKHS